MMRSFMICTLTGYSSGDELRRMKLVSHVACMGRKEIHSGFW